MADNFDTKAYFEHIYTRPVMLETKRAEPN